MVVGFNHNVRYKDQVFHIQTEDSGLKSPHIITLLYVGGTILASKKTSYAELVNEAMNEVLARSLATSLTSLIPVGSLLFVGSLLLGAGTLQDFALALFVGIAAGTYSSIFVAAPLLVALKERADEGTIDPRKRARDRQASTSGYESSRPGRR